MNGLKIDADDPKAVVDKERETGGKDGDVAVSSKESLENEEEAQAKRRKIDGERKSEEKSESPASKLGETESKKGGDVEMEDAIDEETPLKRRKLDEEDKKDAAEGEELEAEAEAQPQVPSVTANIRARDLTLRQSLDFVVAMYERRADFGGHDFRKEIPQGFLNQASLPRISTFL